MVESIIDSFHGEISFIADAACRFLLRFVIAFVSLISLEILADLAIKFLYSYLLYSVASLVETGVAAVAVYHFVFVFALGAKTYLAICLENKF